jgi:hypothetical protein
LLEGLLALGTGTPYYGGFAGYMEITDAFADPPHPGHAEHTARIAGMTGSAGPFDPAFPDIPAMNPMLAEQFSLPESGEKTPWAGGRKHPLVKAVSGQFSTGMRYSWDGDCPSLSVGRRGAVKC